MKKVQAASVLLALLIIVYAAAYLVNYERAKHKINHFNNECTSFYLSSSGGPAVNKPNCYQTLEAGHGFLWLPKVNSSNL